MDLAAPQRLPLLLLGLTTLAGCFCLRSGFMGVVAVLRIQFAQAVTLGESIFVVFSGV
jgi:hypothetical protein